MAESIARFLGTGRYLAIQTIVVAVWIFLNITFSVLRWDPYPFILLNLAFSTQAAYAAPLILLAQNRQDDRDRAALAEDRAAAARMREDTEFLTREVAALRLAQSDAATRQYVRGELTNQLETLRGDIETLLRETLQLLASPAPAGGPGADPARSGRPGAGPDDTGERSTAQNSTAQHTGVQPGTDHPGTDHPGTATAAGSRTGQDGVDQPSTGLNGSAPAGAGQHGAGPACSASAGVSRNSARPAASGPGGPPGAGQAAPSQAAPSEAGRSRADARGPAADGTGGAGSSATGDSRAGRNGTVSRIGKAGKAGGNTGGRETGLQPPRCGADRGRGADASSGAGTASDPDAVRASPDSCREAGPQTMLVSVGAGAIPEQRPFIPPPHVRDRDT